MGRLFILLFLLSFQAKGQWNNLQYYNFNGKIHKGIIIDHGKEVSHLVNQRPLMLEFDTYLQTTGKKEWHQVHRYPQVGCSFNYVLMDPEKPLGNMASLVFYMSKNIIKFKNSSITARVGMGPGYVAKPFHLYDNYKNIMFGSHFNFCLNGRINYSKNIGRYLNLNAGIGIIHFSNAAIALPNQGINIPTVHVGLGFQKNNMTKIVRDTLSPFQRKWLLNISYAGGVKEEYPTDGPRYFASTFSIYTNYRVNRKSGLNIGIDFFHDPSLKRYYNDYDLPINRQIKMGIVAGHELFFGRLSFLTQLGFYLYDKNKIFLPVYQRVGFKYYVNHFFFAQMTMKVHFGSIDYLETGVGFNLFSKSN